jgi:hypothetical protein
LACGAQHAVLLFFRRFEEVQVIDFDETLPNFIDALEIPTSFRPVKFEALNTHNVTSIIP